MAYRRNDSLVDALSVDFILRGESLSTDAIGKYLSLPGLRGFWPMSSFNSSGNAFDLSGQSRTLTYNGNPTYNFAGLAPYLDFDGTGDYLSRSDESGLDIIGTESYVAPAARGLTLGGWFWLDDLLSIKALMFKGNTTAAQSAYEIYVATISGNTHMRVSTGATYIQAILLNGMSSTGTWYFVCGRYDPSTEVKVWVNGQTTETTVSVPASLQNSSLDFAIGATSAGLLPLNGRASFCFLCAAALSDAIINNLFQSSRGLFGV